MNYKPTNATKGTEPDTNGESPAARPPIERYDRILGRKIYGGGRIRKKDGKWYVYYFTMAWGKKVYTFDKGDSWSTSKKVAFESARAIGLGGREDAMRLRV